MNDIPATVGECDWCQTPIGCRRVVTSIDVNTEKHRLDETVGVLLGRWILLLCARCGNRLDTHALRVSLTSQAPVGPERAPADQSSKKADYSDVECHRCHASIPCEEVMTSINYCIQEFNRDGTVTMAHSEGLASFCAGCSDQLDTDALRQRLMRGAYRRPDKGDPELWESSSQRAAEPSRR